MQHTDSVIAPQSASASRTDIRDTTLYEYAQIIVVAFIIVFGFIRPFILEPYKIPSGSMEDTLLVGDRVLVLKFVYGVKLPATGRRLFAFHRPSRGDVFVFSPKHQPQTHFIKRVVAVGGDTVATRGETLVLNGKPVHDEAYVKRTSRLMLADFPPFQHFLVPYFFERDGLAKDFGGFAQRTEVAVQVRDGLPAALTLPDGTTYALRIRAHQRERTSEVPVASYYEVEADGQRRVLTGVLYQNVNTSEWFFLDEMPPSSFFVENPEGRPFVVPNRHLFAMGDNRGNSFDSRAWGPVPFEVVKGKAVLIYWSSDPDRRIPAWKVHQKVRWSRIGRRVRSQYGDVGP